MGLLNADEEVDVSTELVFYVNGKKVCIYLPIVKVITIIFSSLDKSLDNKF